MPADLVTVAVGGPDPGWHFRVAVDGRSSVGPEPTTAPTGDVPVLLAAFGRDDVGETVEVFGAALSREIDPADWLDASSLMEGVTVVAARREPAPSGARGEVTGSVAGGRSVALRAAKWGGRLFAARCSVPAPMGDDLLASLRSVEPVDPGTGRFAEPVRAHTSSLPVAWRTLFPGSWAVEPGAAIEEVASVQATNAVASGGETEVVGKLALAIFARTVATRPREIARHYLDAIADGGLRVLSEEFIEEPLDEGSPFEHSWLLGSGVTRSRSLPGELLCRVMRHPHAWVLAGVLSPRAEDDRAAWMQNKRALDVVTSTMKIKG